MENKERLLKAVETIQNEYDAFLMGNRYSWKEGDNTHAREFEMLSTLRGDKVQNAIAWIHDCYDCYYKEETSQDEDNPFDYLRSVIESEFKEG